MLELTVRRTDEQLAAIAERAVFKRGSHLLDGDLGEPLAILQKGSNNAELAG